MKLSQFSTFFSICFIFLISACESPEPEQPSFSHSTIARNYLNEVLDTMQNNSINRYNIDWSEFRHTVLTVADGAVTIEDTYPGIEKALELLADNHSFFITPDGTGFSASTIRCDQENITETSWPDDIGYVKVNAFSGGASSIEALRFAEEIQDQIRAQDSDQLKGWIVDLRGNLGGNMWPMLAGIGPILGEGTAGYFIDPDNNQTSWGFANGASVVDKIYNVTYLSNSYTLQNPVLKVAVLLNNGIASSGEVMAISFIDRENTRSFGAPTCGLSTSNSTYTLSDGAFLFLTSSYLADRNKSIYGGTVMPDVQVDQADIIQVATDWLME